MKIIYRILYAFTIVIMFLAMNNLANRITANKYFEEEGLNQYLSNQEDKYRFFYGTTGFHKKEANYTFEQNDFKVQFFEINKVFTKKNSPTKVEEYYYIMIDHPDIVFINDFPHRYYLRITTLDEEVKSLKIKQFKSLPFSVVVDENDSGLIDVERFLDKDYNKIEIFEFDEEEDDVILLSSNASFSKNDLTMKHILVDNYSNESLLEENGIYYPLDINIKKYVYIYYSLMIGYLFIVFLATYLIFVFRKRYSNKQ